MIGAKVRKTGFLRLFAPPKKSFCPKIKTLAWSEPKLKNDNFTAVLVGYTANGGRIGF